jgi:hypothetical protein
MRIAPSSQGGSAVFLKNKRCRLRPLNGRVVVVSIQMRQDVANS